MLCVNLGRSLLLQVLLMLLFTIILHLTLGGHPLPLPLLRTNVSLTKTCKITPKQLFLIIAPLQWKEVCRCIEYDPNWGPPFFRAAGSVVAHDASSTDEMAVTALYGAADADDQDCYDAHHEAVNDSVRVRRARSLRRQTHS